MIKLPNIQFNYNEGTLKLVNVFSKTLTYLFFVAIMYIAYKFTKSLKNSSDLFGIGKNFNHYFSIY